MGSAPPWAFFLAWGLMSAACVVGAVAALLAGVWQGAVVFGPVALFAGALCIAFRPRHESSSADERPPDSVG